MAQRLADDPTNRTKHNGFRLALNSAREASNGPEVPDGTDRLPDRIAQEIGPAGRRDGSDRSNGSD
jgi:hypothetical protein